jgi:hypothetical protein
MVIICTFYPNHSSFYTDLEIKALSHPHDDLPSDMQMFAQLIVDQRIFLQTMLADPRPFEDCWKLKPDCKMCVHDLREEYSLWLILGHSPEHALTFVLVIIRHSKTRGTRLLGSIQVAKDDVLMSGDQKICACSHLSW